MMSPEELEADDPILSLVADGFTGAKVLDPVEMLFQDDDERTLSMWDDTDWWTGEAKDAPVITDAMTSTREERAQAQETFAQQTPGSAASFRAAEAATMPSKSTLRWFQMDNGRISLDKLVKVGGINYLRQDAAKSYRAMKRAAKKDGINLTFSGPQSGYRDYATQERLFREKGDSDTGGLAADPGTSNHGWGMAIDLAPEGREWVAAHGKRFGFHGISTESWHFDFQPTAGATDMPRPKRKPRPVKAKPPKADEVGAELLSDPISSSQGNSFMDAIMSLTEDDVEVQTARGKRTINLSDSSKPTNSAEIVQYARRIAKKYGWTGKQFHALNEIVMRESGWNPEADNPTSTASGIPQRLMSAHPFSQGEKRKWQDPRYQVRWLLSYINGRYDSPSEALRFHNENGWY